MQSCLPLLGLLSARHLLIGLIKESGWESAGPFILELLLKGLEHGQTKCKPPAQCKASRQVKGLQTEALVSPLLQATGYV